MGYLNISGGIPSFNKAVISLWFRVPSASARALQASASAFNVAGDPHYVYPRLWNVLPLMTFGQLFEGYQLDNGTPGPTGNYQFSDWYTPFSGWELLTTETHQYTQYSVYSKIADYLANPSFIGVQYEGDDDSGNGTFNLKLFLQTADFGNPTWVASQSRSNIGDENYGFPTRPVPTETHWSYFPTPGFKTDSPAPGNPWLVRITYEDMSDLYLGQKGPDSFEAGFDINVTLDTWHHALISFDLSHPTSATGQYSTNANHGTDTSFTPATLVDPCKMWIALDDVNYTDTNIYNQGATDGNGTLLQGPNDIISRNTYAAVTAQNATLADVAWDVTGVVQDFLNTHDGNLPSYTYPAGMLPALAHSLGIPSADNASSSILKCEMAEFQMWTGVTLDTSVEANRRAFLDYKLDAHGNKVLDSNGNARLIPVDMAKAQRLLGKAELQLHKSANWIAGKDTGSGPQFIPAGTIKKYPDPFIVVPS